MSVDGELDTVGLIVNPLAALAGSFVTLYMFTNLLRLLAITSTKSWAASKGELGNAVQPITEFLKKAIEAAMGPIGSLKLGLDHLLLGAILIVLVGIWRNSSRQVQVAQKALKASQDEKKKN